MSATKGKVVKALLLLASLACAQYPSADNAINDMWWRIDALARQVLCVLWGVVAGLLALVIVIAGVRYLTSQDAEGRGNVKKAIIQGFAALVIVATACPVINYLAHGTDIREFRCDCVQEPRPPTTTLLPPVTTFSVVPNPAARIVVTTPVTTTSTTTTTTTTTTAPGAAETYNVVYVPIGWTPSEYDAFKALADKAYAYLLQKAPVSECPNPGERIKAYFIHPANCTVASCSNHCSDCISKARQCVINNGLGGIYDVFGVITKDPNGGFQGGCACGIPCDGESLSSSFEPSHGHVHEMGHDFGLCHVNLCGAQGGNSGCANWPDISSANNQDIMTYCFNTWDRYFPAAYGYLKSNVFSKYMSGC